MAKRGSPPNKPAAKASAPERVPIKTRTLPDGQRGAWFVGPDVVTMLRVYGSSLAFELPGDQKLFTLGSSPDRDLVVPDGFLSALHCVLERRGDRLRVHDQGSYNGTYFDGRRESSFELRPGNTFTAASIRFLALNEPMAVAYPVLAEILGSEDEHVLHSPGKTDASPSDLIVTATSGANMLVTGEPGCDQDRLARTIHGISLLRGRDLVAIDAVPDDRAQQRAALDRASRSTLVLTIAPKAPVIDATFAAMLFSSSFHIRVIVIAPTVAKADAVLGQSYVRTMRHVSVPPLAHRSGAILRLLDRMFVERDTPLRAAELAPVNQAALHAYSWPGNFTDLRLAADRIVAIAREGSVNKAAKALGISTSTLHYWFTQVGLTQPLVEVR